MLDRLFGRGKQDQPAEPTCAACGRTLLPGEWAQTFVRDDGVEEIVCSLCSQSQGYMTEPPEPFEQDDAHSAPDAHSAVARESAAGLYDQGAARGGVHAYEVAPVAQEHGAAQWAAPEAGAATEPVATIGEPHLAGDRGESDAFWRALKDKDAEIAGLQAEVMRLEAERRELGARLEQARQVAPPAPAVAAYPSPMPPGPGLRAEGEASTTPELAASQPAADSWPAPVMPGVADEWSTAVAPGAGDDLIVGAPPQPSTEIDIPVDLYVPPEQLAPSDYMAEEPAPVEAAISAGAAGPPVAAAIDMPTEPIAVVASPEQAAAPEEWCPVCDTAEIPDAQPTPTAVDPEEGTVQMPVVEGQPAPVVAFVPQPEPVDLVPLQRGADLFNVSDMPQRVAETNELLGLPRVNLSVDEKTMTAVFIWSMAWYEYTIDLDDGDVRLKDRGYDDRTDLVPNGTVRPDGTMQLIPLPTRRAVVQNPPPAPPDVPVQPAPAPAAPAGEDEDRRPIDAGKGEFISKSLRGQRTDDEAVAWDEMAARDFDWGH